MHGLAVYVKEGLPFAWGLSLENCRFLTGIFSLSSYFFFIYGSPSPSLCTISDAISFNVNEVPSVNPATILVELIGLVNYVILSMLCISNDLAQMVNVPTWIPDCDSHSPPLLDVFLSSNVGIIYSNVVVSVSIDFPLNSEQDASFCCIVHGYSRAAWDGLCDVLWEDKFKLSASAVASEFCEWVQVGIDVYIAHCKY